MGDDPVSARHEPIPDSTELLGREHARRRKRLFVGMGVLAAAVVGAGVASVVLQQRSAEAGLRARSADLSACLFGRVVPPSEAPARLLRDAQLAAMGLTEPERAGKDGSAWPQRCGLVAQELMEAAKAAGHASKEDEGDLADRADALAKALKAPASQFADLSQVVDTTWAALAKTGVVVEASARVPGPPAVAKPLRAADVGEGSAIATTPFPFHALGVSSYSGDVFHVLVQDAAVPRAPFVCAFDDGPVRCRSIVGDLAKGQNKLAIAGVAAKGSWPLLVAGEDGELGLFRSDTGAKVADTAPPVRLLGASIDAKGVVRTLQQEGSRLAMATLGETEKEKEKEKRWTRGDLPERCTPASAGLVDDQVVVECRVPFGADRHAGEWMLLALGKDLPRAERVEEVPADADAGAEAPEAPTLRPGTARFCRSGETMVAGYGSSLFFHDGLGWAKPQKGALRGGGISCAEKVANVTLLADAGGDRPWRSEIAQTRCTVAECAKTSVEFERLLRGGLEGAPRGKLFDAAAAGDAMVVAWASGQLGGVRVRVGAPDTLVAARDVVVFDDLATEGELAGKADLLELVVLGQPRQATLLLRSSRGVHAIRLTTEGGFAPAEVVWEGESRP